MSQSFRVLLTGGTGFVGRKILQHLIYKNYTVRLIVRSGKQNHIPTGNQIEAILTSPDIFSESLSWWEKACEGIDVVIHAAWYAEPGKYLQSERNLDCLNGTLTLAKACERSGVRRFVGLGTCFEYDLDLGYLGIDAPLKPITLYGATKAAAYSTLSQYLSSVNVEFVWCRLFYLYGDGEDERRLVPYLHAKLAAGELVELTSGKQIRDFMDVDLAAQMIVETVRGSRQGAINICSAIPITVRNFAEKIADQYGRRDLLCFGARVDNILDPVCVVGVL